MHTLPRRVVILGGGYAGVRVAWDLARAKQRPGEIVLVSDQPEHIELPSLYEVATAYLPHESIHSSEYICRGMGVDLAEIFQRLPVKIRIGGVDLIRPTERLLIFKDKSSLSLDWLVLALGTQLNTFGVPGVQEYGFSLKNLTEALRLRHHIVRQVLLAKKMSPSHRQATLTFVVVGAGATGVETASELIGLLKRLFKDHQLEQYAWRVIMVEAGGDILREVPVKARAMAGKRLQKLGIEIMINRRVVAVDPHSLTLDNEESIASSTVIWSAGLAPHGLLMRSGLPVKMWGVATLPTLQVRGFPFIFAAGDNAILEERAKPLPAIVPVAYTEGSMVAHNIMQLAKGQPLKSFNFHNRGQLISIGGKWAVAVLGEKLAYVGWLPWLVKKLVTLRYWWWYLPPWRAVMVWWNGVEVQCRND